MTNYTFEQSAHAFAPALASAFASSPRATSASLCAAALTSAIMIDRPDGKGAERHQEVLDGRQVRSNGEEKRR